MFPPHLVQDHVLTPTSHRVQDAMTRRTELVLTRQSPISSSSRLPLTKELCIAAPPIKMLCAAGAACLQTPGLPSLHASRVILSEVNLDPQAHSFEVLESLHIHLRETNLVLEPIS